MSVRTGVDFDLFGGLSGSATQEQVNFALDIGWNSVEDILGTNIILTLEEDEEHLTPYVMSDWHRRDDRITLKKTYVVTVPTVTILEETDYCNCTTTEYEGCGLLVDGRLGIIAIRDCISSAAQNCRGCGSRRPFRVLISYTAGLFAAPPLPGEIQLAVVMKAREALAQITGGDLTALGSLNVTSWRSMDYSETRKGPSGDSYIDDYIKKNLLKDYIVKRAFSLRRTT